LRPYQRSALLGWQLVEGRGLVVLPTGAGKTHVALAAMAQSGLPSLCLVPTRALLHQWRTLLESHQPGRVARFGDGQRELGPITVSTFESAYRHMARFGGEFGLLIVDEVHHFGQGAKDECLEMCAAPLRLGLTATPPDGAQLEQLCRLLGPIAYELSIADLAGRWLADYDVVVLRLALTPEERAAYVQQLAVFDRYRRRFRARSSGLDWQAFVRESAQTPEGRQALFAWHRSRKVLRWTAAKRAAVGRILARHRGSRILIFTEDNETCYAISREFLVMPITCEIKRRERERALADFRAGKLLALASSRVLNEGIDVPDAEVAIMVGGALGQREHVQRVGRLLRRVPGKQAVVYELVTQATPEVRKALIRRQALAARALPLP
jgi:superfamily II DNA or RNA helicase